MDEYDYEDLPENMKEEIRQVEQKIRENESLESLYMWEY